MNFLIKIYNYYSGKERATGVIPVAMTTVMIAVLGGCMANYGRLRIDPDIGERFYSGAISPGHTYYYSGWNTNPYAIVGIRDDYNIRSAYWTRVDHPEKNLKKLIDFLYIGRNGAPYGARIMGPRGKPIGFWYSTIRQVSIKVDMESGTVVILPGTPYLEEDNGFLGIADHRVLHDSPGD